MYSDYSTSAGLARSIVEDLDIGEIEQGDFLYSIFLDSPMAMGGANQRFATGILVDKTGRDKKKRLMGLNEGIRAVKYTDDDDDYSVEKVWKQIEYKSTSLPSLDAAIVQFPFTNGFVSALTHSYKVRWKGEANGIVRYILHPDWSWKAGKFLCSHPISICYRSYLPFAKSPNKKVKRATFLL